MSKKKQAGQIFVTAKPLVASSQPTGCLSSRPIHAWSNLLQHQVHYFILATNISL